MTYKLVIFDFDGTLADSADWVRSVLDQVAGRFRFKRLTEDEFQMLRDKDTRTILAQMGVATWKLPLIAHHMRGLVARDAAKIPVFRGVHELLAALERRGIAVAVVSSNAERNVRTILGPASSARIRFYACGAGLFGKRKKFRAVLRRAGVLPTDAIAIGDEVRDIEAAKCEGIPTGAVSWGYATRDILLTQRPTFMFESIPQMQQALTVAG